MLRNMTIGTRLKGSFLLLGILILLIAFLSLARMSETARVVSEEQRIRTTELGPLYRMREALDQTGIAARNAYIYRDEADARRELDLLDRHRADYLASLQELRPRLANQPGFAALSGKLETMGRELQRPRGYREAGSMDAFGKFLVDECSPLRRQIVQELNLVIGRIEEQLDRASDEVDQVVTASQRIIAAIAALIAAAAATLAWVVTASIVRPLGAATRIAESVATGDLTHRIVPTSSDELGMLMRSLGNMQAGLQGIVGNVREGSDLIARNSRDIAQGNLHLSNRTEAQASALQQTAATMQSLTETVRTNAADAQAADTLAQEASRIAVRGGAVVDDVVATMGQISGESHKIVDIIGLIDALAFQTNILALNAAVEAARAGEQGRGFAVVAGEVRDLAQRSAAASREIRVLIHSSVARIDSGAALAGQTGATMQELMRSVQQVSTVIRRIAAASEQQASGVQELNAAVGHIDDLTQQNAALVEQASASAALMHEHAEDLERHVAVFRTGAGRALLAA